MKFAFCMLFLSFNLLAQEDKKIMEPVNTLFEGMKDADSAKVHSAFHPLVKMFTVIVDAKTQQPRLREDGLQGFLKAIGTPHPEVYNELIWSPKIEVDGNLAQVWVPYAFYTGKTFSHCGVDAFQMIRDGQGNWKIFYLADTRRKEACVIPPEISEKIGR